MKLVLFTYLVSWCVFVCLLLVCMCVRERESSNHILFTALGNLLRGIVVVCFSESYSSMAT